MPFFQSHAYYIIWQTVIAQTALSNDSNITKCRREKEIPLPIKSTSSNAFNRRGHRNSLDLSAAKSPIADIRHSCGYNQVFDLFAVHVKIRAKCKRL